MKRIYLSLFLILTIILIAPSISSGAEYHGLVSVEDYYSSDSSSAYNFNFLTTRLRLDATKLDEAGNLSFHFDGRERNNLGTKDYNSKYIKNERIDRLNLEYAASDRFYLAVGRMWPKELSIERVDGVNLIFQSTAYGLGLFGGMKPNPYTEEFNSEYTTAGGYLFYRREDTSASLAFTNNGYKSGIDRQYMYGQLSSSLTKILRFYGSVTADNNQLNNNTDLTNLILELSFRPTYGRNLTFGYNQFRSFRLYKSMEFDIANTEQQSYYARGDYRFYDRYTLYGKYELQSLQYRAYTTETKGSNIYQIGLRNDNLMNKDISLDINAIMADSYSSGYNSYNVEAGKFFTERFQMVFNGSYMQTKYTFTDYTDTITNYGAYAYWFLSKKWNLSVSYDGRQGKDYSTNTVISRITYKF